MTRGLMSIDVGVTVLIKIDHDHVSANREFFYHFFIMKPYPASHPRIWTDTQFICYRYASFSNIFLGYTKMSSDLNFEIEKRFENGNAYMISGIQIASGAPTAGQFLVYNVTTNQWEYGAVTIGGIPIQAGTPADGQQLQYNLAQNQWLFV